MEKNYPSGPAGNCSKREPKETEKFQGPDAVRKGTVSSTAQTNATPRISVVTPTLKRPEEVAELLQNLATQKLLPVEFILVDGAPDGEEATRAIAESEFSKAPFPCRYFRHGGGTAIQRNVGIEAATGDFIALIDDDIRLEPDFFLAIVGPYQRDRSKNIGGIVGYRTNEHFDPETAVRWRWYRRLGLLSVYEPGRYDYRTGYPINANMQPPFTGVREVDFMTTACAVWRRQLFDEGMQFDPFFRGYGMLEDAHFSLRAGRKWKLLQCGEARCQHLVSPHGRANREKLGYMRVVNYYYVFRDIAGPLSAGQKMRFWRYQAFECLRMLASGFRRLRKEDFFDLAGRLRGVKAIITGAAWRRNP
jgi:glycosyltransferase involved in cell wall biosynthesis